MKILLAIDESPCSEAAVEAVLRQFTPEDSEVRVRHVDEWPKGIPTYPAFAEGPAAASQVVSTHDETRRRGEELLGSDGRRGIDRFLLGSVSESVMRHATCSVEVVRPS